MQPLEVFTNRLNFPKNVFSLSEHWQANLARTKHEGRGQGNRECYKPLPPSPPNQPSYLTKAIFRVVKNRCGNHHK